MADLSLRSDNRKEPLRFEYQAYQVHRAPGDGQAVPQASVLQRG